MDTQNPPLCALELPSNRWVLGGIFLRVSNGERPLTGLPATCVSPLGTLTLSSWWPAHWRGVKPARTQAGHFRRVGVGAAAHGARARQGQGTGALCAPCCAFITVSESAH